MYSFARENSAELLVDDDDVTWNNNNVMTLEKDVAEEAMRDVLGADKRLAHFGYTHETITMLLLPMVDTKLVRVS